MTVYLGSLENLALASAEGASSFLRISQAKGQSKLYIVLGEYGVKLHCSEFSYFSR